LGIEITKSVKDCDGMILDIQDKNIKDRTLLVKLFDLQTPYVLVVSNIMDAGLWDRQLVMGASLLVFYGEDIREEYIRRYGSFMYCMSDDLWEIWRAISGTV
jgi:hypothetical protein